MKHALAAMLLSVVAISIGIASAEEKPRPVAAALAVTPAKLTTDSNVGELLADPRAKAIVLKYAPGLIGGPEVALIANVPFKQLAQYPQTKVTPDMLTKIDADLAKEPQ